MNPNRKRLSLQPKTLAAVLGGALILAACGGSPGGSPGGSTGDSATISGVAAAGLPLVGTVTVKDALGVTRQAPIGTNGSYSIDVSGMTAPFVFRASGRAGGREYVIHSAATAADVRGVINVTPLTDLVLSNIASQVAASYFERNPSSIQLTPEALTAEATHLRNRLLPVLQAMGVDASVDLLRTPFTPLASALDKALDILRVSYSNNVATITNVVTQQQIQDSLATSAAQEASAPTMNNTTGVATAATDIDQIRAAMGRFSDLFANGMPAAGVVAAELSSGFLFRDQPGNVFAADLASFDLLNRAAFTDLTLDRIEYPTTGAPRALVSFVIKSPQGHLIAPHEDNWQLVKQSNIWRLHGDQRVLDVESVAYMHHTTFRTGNNAPGDCRQSGLSLRVQDPVTTNNGGTVVDVIVTGPGIPASGARLTPSSLGGEFGIDTTTSNGGQGNYYVTADTCNTTTNPNGFEVSGLANVPDNALYTFTVRGAGGAVLHTYTDRVPKRPLTLAELRASTEFPAIAAPTFDAFGTYPGGNITVQASRFDLMGLAGFEVVLGYSNGTSNDVFVERLVPASGADAPTLTLPGAPAGTSINYRRLEVRNFAPNSREFSHRYVIH